MDDQRMRKMDIMVLGGQIFLIWASFYVASCIPWRFFMMKEVKEEEREESLEATNTSDDEEAVVVTQGSNSLQPENPLDDVANMLGNVEANGRRPVGRRVFTNGNNYLCSLNGKRA